MVKLNHHYQKLSDEILFPQIEKKVALLQSKSPQASWIHLETGDVTRPLSPSLVYAMTNATQEMGEKSTFRGYGPSNGYSFLREAIAEGDYKNLGISPDEIFISDGAKSDLSNLQELFSLENRVALPDPSCPIYLDTNIMAGRTRLPLKTGRYGGITYLECTEENGFLPSPPGTHTDLIYLCSPNNPTGTSMDKSLLKQWIDYARNHEAIILFDGTYEAYITSDAPHSIYEIEGAKEVAVEIRSFSKTAGFTGLRCSYTVIPRQIQIRDVGKTHSLHSLWTRRCQTKSNGVSYPIQKAAAAIYTQKGQQEVKELVRTYSERARFFLHGLQHLGYKAFGGIDAPYIWCKTPEKMNSWEFFDLLLEKAQIVATPGTGFGSKGAGFVRFSAFAEPTALAEGLLRIKTL